MSESATVARLVGEINACWLNGRYQDLVDYFVNSPWLWRMGPAELLKKKEVK